ncbi:MAG: PIN domain-containing protein [Patescibacteria group bacterium]
MALHVFIDTNIYLSFYHYTDDDLEALKKLVTALDQRGIVLYLPDHARSEFRRNRETKIADAIREFQLRNTVSKFPQLVQLDANHTALSVAAREFSKLISKAVQNIREEAAQDGLKADKTLEEIFSKAIVLETATIIDKAVRRMDLGHPPGKNNSYGDAICWLSLLANVPQKEDLYLISKDSDYRSPLHDGEILDCLKDEWKIKKNSQVYLYPDLSQFFRDKYPNIQLADELARSLAIDGFANTRNFETTHKSVAVLSKFSEFTDDELRSMLQAAIQNNQIHWVHDDQDVNEFVKFLYNRGVQLLSDEERKAIEQLYQVPGLNLDEF